MKTFALIFLATTLHNSSANGVLGDWKTPTASIIRVEPCGADICLRVVKLSPTAPATTDIHNPDAALHSRKLCGLIVGTGFHQDDPAHLTGGHLYDPKSGHTYRGTITAAGDSLDLHGYIGISLFGRSETWTRTTPVPTCKG